MALKRLCQNDLQLSRCRRPNPKDAHLVLMLPFQEAPRSRAQGREPCIARRSPLETRQQDFDFPRPLQVRLIQRYNNRFLNHGADRTAEPFIFRPAKY